jgi:hypothetical protein
MKRNFVGIEGIINGHVRKHHWKLDQQDWNRAVHNRRFQGVI